MHLHCGGRSTEVSACPGAGAGQQDEIEGVGAGLMGLRAGWQEPHLAVATTSGRRVAILTPRSTPTIFHVPQISRSSTAIPSGVAQTGDHQPAAASLVPMPAGAEHRLPRRLIFRTRAGTRPRLRMLNPHWHASRLSSMLEATPAFGTWHCAPRLQLHLVCTLLDPSGPASRRSQFDSPTLMRFVSSPQRGPAVDLAASVGLWDTRRSLHRPRSGNKSATSNVATRRRKEESRTKA